MRRPAPPAIHIPRGRRLEPRQAHVVGEPFRRRPRPGTGTIFRALSRSASARRTRRHWTGFGRGRDGGPRVERRAPRLDRRDVLRARGLPRGRRRLFGLRRPWLPLAFPVCAPRRASHRRADVRYVVRRARAPPFLFCLSLRAPRGRLVAVGPAARTSGAWSCRLGLWASSCVPPPCAAPRF